MGARLRHVPAALRFLWVRSALAIHMFGWRHGAPIAWHGLRGRSTLRCVQLPGTTVRVWCRLGRTHSDLNTLADVSRGAYEFGVEDPQVVVDAGANAGYSAVWFARRYPQARVLAIEPDPANVEVLRRNVADYPNVEVIEAALMNFDGTGQVIDPGLGGWGMRVQPEGSRWSPGRVVGSIRCVSPRTLFEQCGIDHVGYLKVDIEGSEVDLFSGDTSWMDVVDNMAIELHDRFRDGCSAAFRRATARFGWEQRRGADTFVSVVKPASVS